MSTYVSASTVEEALEAMSGGARPVAGGTDLVVGARQGKAPLPDSIVAIHAIDGLRGISGSGGGLRLGALATHEELVTHPVVRERFTALADAAAIVGSHATRAHGTIGGNLMNASPAMETGGPLVCFDATVTLQSGGGSRELPVAELFAGPGQTTADAGELLTAVDIPEPAAGTGLVLRAARVPKADGDRGRGRNRSRRPGRRQDQRCAHRHHGARPDHPSCIRSRVGARRNRRHPCTGRGGSEARPLPPPPRSPTSAPRRTTGARWPP